MPPRSRSRAVPGCLPVPVLGLLLLIACGSDAWKANGAPKTSPDVQFRTGVEVGYDAWLWNCYEGERVLVTQSGSACFGTSAPRVVRGPCGKPLPEEAQLAPPESRHEIPEGSRWPNSTPESWRVRRESRDASTDASRSVITPGG